MRNFECFGPYVKINRIRLNLVGIIFLVIPTKNVSETKEMRKKIHQE